MPLIQQMNVLMLEVADIFTATLENRKIKISELLQTQTNIRVYVTASSGLGHQATTIGILYRLIELGYNTVGKAAQIIYDNADGDTAGKLKFLIPGFNPLDPQPVTLSNVVFNFITRADFELIAEPETIPFGFTGGYDGIADNLATRCHVEFFLKLQPFQWPEMNAIQRQNLAADTYINLQTIPALGNAAFVNQGYYVPPPVMGDLQYQWFGAAAPAKVAPYQQIIAACTGDDALNLMALYGIGNKIIPESPQSAYVIEAMPDVRSATALFYLVAAVANRQNNSVLPHLQKAAVIVNIASNTDLSYAEFDTLISGAKPDSIGLNEYVNTNHLTTGQEGSRILIRNFDAVDLEVTLAALQEEGQQNKILIIKMSGLPLYAFDYMYAQSTLPPVFEGKGTANLVLNLNKPYINLVKGRMLILAAGPRRVVYPTLPLAAAPGATAQGIQNNQVYRLNDGIAAFNTNAIDNFPTSSVNMVATLIEQSYTPDSEINTYFTALNAFYNDENNDKLLLSLCYFMSYVNGLPIP